MQQLFHDQDLSKGAVIKHGKVEYLNQFKKKIRVPLEQPISPERFSSRTHGYPSTIVYIDFSRSGTDSNEFNSPEAAQNYNI